ncbi:DNA cytosine methyltransferase [Pontibacter chinhatensis]|uniref:Cytosine-specific methyltransferase n=1 Tax=Pontibacter chinhatensis TaxID=1436961 RepID=A0A1I2ZT00_9BACT|nr:DNA cytosine methyltransferase [Pontibacter chinhatensis]SFH40745.1 DNA (cytosine-5)-methyltransferase 1 [Pontibacter chinhatensis]
MRVGSLFSGCGGMDLGFIQAGFDVVWANDFDKHACKVYADNIGPIIHQDVCTLEADSLDEIDVLCGGFPCQPFSSAGKRKGVEDHRGNLFFETLRIVKHHRPKAVVFENVRGLLSTKNATGNKLIDDIQEVLENLDENLSYKVKWKLLNASHYGVPQNRYRVFIVGIRSDIEAEFKFPAEIIPQNPQELTVDWIINYDKDLPNQEHWKLSPQASLMAEYIKEGGSWKDVPYDVLPPRFKRIADNIKHYRSPNFYRRFSRNEINGTITASAQPENCGILHPLENRRYNVREVARIQSFPDNFRFDLDMIQEAYKVIGNAVPPRLAYHVGKAVLDTLTQHNSDNISSAKRSRSLTKEPSERDLILK